MRRLLVLVEGQTEETFVRDVLDPHLWNFGVAAIATILKTKRVKSGGTFRGGVTSSMQVMDDLRRLLADTDAVAVTSVVDYYGLPADFPGMNTRPLGHPRTRVAHVEQAWSAMVDDVRFVPHLVLHEYEAWVYADPPACAWIFEDPALPATLVTIRDRAGEPEMINERPNQTPARQLSRAYRGYRKPLHGPMAVAAIGLATVRSMCPHAAAWLDHIETL